MKAGIERFPGEMLPVRPIDRDRLHLDQDFIVRRGRCGDLGEVKPTGWAVGSVHHGFHASPPLGFDSVWPARTVGSPPRSAGSAQSSWVLLMGGYRLLPGVVIGPGVTPQSKTGR